VASRDPHAGPIALLVATLGLCACGETHDAQDCETEYPGKAFDIDIDGGLATGTAGDAVIVLEVGDLEDAPRDAFFPSSGCDAICANSGGASTCGLGASLSRCGVEEYPLPGYWKLVCLCTVQACGISQ